MVHDPFHHSDCDFMHSPNSLLDLSRNRFALGVYDGEYSVSEFDVYDSGYFRHEQNSSL